MRLAVAHEWLTNWAGSEAVAEQMVRTADPDELVASVVEPRLARERFGSLPVRSLWPGRLPGATMHWSRYAPAMLAAWARTRIDADALLVSAHFAAHAATVRFDGPSVVYYHTPARILWRTEIELGRLPAAARAATAATVLPPLRAYDRWVGQHPTTVLASSGVVAQRIERAYGRSAQVVNPPVAVDRFRGIHRARDTSHVVWLGRLVPYKRPDLAVEAARRAGLPLTVVGDGPERARLEATAPDHVRFLGHVNEATLRAVLADARVMVFPGEEDFGIAPVEALAAGVPVVAPARGGALDYLDHGVNAVLTDDQDPDVLAAALRTAWDARWDHTAMRAATARFAPARFRSELGAVLDATVGAGWRRPARVRLAL
ncbi:glycosyltransferase family 4 protein [Actinomycetospora chlora]|uniref:Glycosyltransferase family 4 protein n=1 Tax=Actinomycetospora chlora TaxID=663608 RepID=A0ABP9CM33_9PSEU